MWVDITHTLEETIAPWPGDPAFKLHYFTTKAENGSANIAEIKGSNHIGTHIDAAKHVSDEGWTVDQIDVQRLIGDATLLSFTDRTFITREDLVQQQIEGTILLLKTRTVSDPTTFPSVITTLSGEAIDYLAEIGIQVIGVDIPSVDTLDSETLDNHHRLASHQMYHIENLRLDDVTAGQYRFIGLPLKIKDGDAAYLRAVVQKK
ncbi:MULTISPECIES: cyclase family protein [unclassified Staphylococcus]|uniref:cyclase family protein n=1 Tax=unclassified Staphylococcus TaxID=91994 RepID=UPI0021CFA718|nr:MULTISPECIES: cyclase family protein [unclassified Staphylococcus]UXR69440.1 cyclase family protein [Staphylococcus sp. IVB6246]UXR73773.1 cyclase family protein [Staphylococcus sp. IVB6238]UXR76092.1 cyclase family protein [Staphylococcus sp. IVB6233]UXR80290.1 cyclase family protein [Staphylococcus sp. IVB6218]